MDLSLLSDADILAIHEHVRMHWSRLHWAFFDDKSLDEDEFDPVSVFVTANRVHVHYHKHSFEMGLVATGMPPKQTDKAAFIAHFDACLRKLVERIADELMRLGAKRSQLSLKRWDFEEPRDAWLPIQTIAFALDFIRVGRILLNE